MEIVRPVRDDGRGGGRHIEIRTLHELPVFTDAALTRMDVLHRPACPAALDTAGRSRDRRCGCTAEEVRLAQGLPVALHLEVDGAVLVEPEGRAPVWVERTGLHLVWREKTAIQETHGAGLDFGTEAPRKGPVPGGAASIPADLEILRHRFNRGWRWPRRMRPIKVGELVWVRGEEKTPGTVHRYLCEARGSGATVFLVDPALDAEAALYAAWGQVRRVGLPEPDAGLERVLYPVFPLMDETVDPGWGPKG
jgi:hypothetical protein